MKNILLTIILLSLSLFSVSAEYIEGKDNTPQEGMMGITTTSIEVDEPRMCTMEYAPVCAEVQVQCITTPCFPVQKTFGNTCSAGNNSVLFSGECTNYINDSLYKKYESKREQLEKLVAKVKTKTLVKINDLLDQKIKMTKMSRIAVEMQKQRITKYAFIKSVISTELKNR
ncbi:MAG: hypothetical protein GY828_01305 [Candidatus Gracilibacteria bacterium]|nr:hypothetical protein [Candidatus Gracilibacteria bacterium]